MEELSIGEFAKRSRLSLKALRLYDELDVLPPARVDHDSGYRYYDASQLERARRIAMLRQLEFSLTDIRELLACDSIEASQRIAKQWQHAEVAHDARRDLATFLVNELSGKRTIMHEVSTREMPERSLLCLKRNISSSDAWAFGKEFIAILRERPTPKIDGREGAAFSIFWGEISEDSDGPMEWCRPIPTHDAEALASQYPEFALRSEPAHREAFVNLSTGPEGYSVAEFQLAGQALEAWAVKQGFVYEDLAIKPEDLGMRVTYLAHEPIKEPPVPDIDLAVPYSLKN